MANLASNSSGNFTAAGTWSLIDTTSFSNSTTSSASSTTSFVSSGNFTPGAIVIDGIGLYVNTRSAGTTGTFSVRLFNSTGAAAVAGTTVTVNATDIDPAPTTVGLGWSFFKFSAPVTLIAATVYNVQISSSVNSTVTIYRSVTTSDWSRFLRTTTTQAPAAGDSTFIQGDWTAAGTQATRTVTMDSTSNVTSYGNMEISKGGTLSYGTSASTNYFLNMAGTITVWSSGTLSLGTNGTPIPSTSTADLQFNCTSNVQYGLTVSSAGNFNAFGTSMTTDRALLAADAAIAATSLTTSVSTGWKNGDVIVLASTTRTAGDSESKALTADAVGTGLTITALTNAHSGTSPTQGELINLSRKVRVYGVSTVNQAYIFCRDTSQVNMSWVEIYNMGSATANKRGIDITTQLTGIFNVQNCSIHDFVVASSLGFNCSVAANTGITISNNVIYNIASNCLFNTASATTGASQTFSNNIAIKNTSAVLVNLSNCKITLTNNTVVSATTIGMSLSDSTYDGTGSISGNVVHSNTTNGVFYTSIFSTIPYSTGFGSCTAWRNVNTGIVFNSCSGVVFDTATCFGNGTANIGSSAPVQNCILKSFTLDAGTTLTCPVGLSVSGASPFIDVYIDNSLFGTNTPHSTGDVNFAASSYSNLIFRNSTMSSTTTVATQGNMLYDTAVRFAKLNTTAGNHKTFRKFGAIQPDTTIFNVASPSDRMTPNSATAKLETGKRKVAIPNGTTATISVSVRKSVVGDGTVYNGNQPRLIVKANPAIGIASDTVLATADNTFNGAFKILTGTSPSVTDDAALDVVVDCDGTTGWINVDDWKVS